MVQVLILVLMYLNSYKYRKVVMMTSSLQGYHGDSVLVSGIGTGFAIVNVKLVDPVWKVSTT